VRIDLSGVQIYWAGVAEGRAGVKVDRETVSIDRADAAGEWSGVKV